LTCLSDRDAQGGSASSATRLQRPQSWPRRSPPAPRRWRGPPSSRRPSHPDGAVVVGSSPTTNVKAGAEQLEPVVAAAEDATHVVDERRDGDRSSPRRALHFTPTERAARGKAARGEQPRSAHADWAPAPRRAD